MAKRSYQQHCGLAVALDLLAERWSMLVIRELLPGGRRFSELFESLHGVSTDLLTARLRSLEEADVVRRRTVRHPAKATVYELTERGEALRPIVEDLAQWGVELLPDPGEYRLDARWGLGAIAMSYRGGLPDGDYSFVIDDEDLTIRLDGDGARFFYGPTTSEPRVRLTCTGDEFLELAVGVLGAAGLPDGLEFDGDRADLVHLVGLLPLPSRPAP